MLVVETIAKIRRMHFGQGMGIKTIFRELNLSKKVVRKVVRSGATEFSYKRTVQPRPKLGAWLAELDRLFATNAALASRERLGIALPASMSQSARPDRRRAIRASGSNVRGCAAETTVCPASWMAYRHSTSRSSSSGVRSN